MSKATLSERVHEALVGTSSEHELCEAVEAMESALRELLERYIYLVRESGVCRWDPETDLKVIAARAALDGL
jgi:hypothetical protein